MKSNRIRFFIWLPFLTLLLTGCGQEPDTDPMLKRITQRCGEIASVYREAYRERTESDDSGRETVFSQSSIDDMEAILIEAGLDVLDTSGEDPAYLTTADRFREFWQCVQQEETAEQEVVKITESGNLWYLLFTCENGEGLYFGALYHMDSGEVTSYETHEILDWELTERGNFYYQIYSEDHKHYGDYSLIRLEKPDPELMEMTRRYIRPVGYIAVNLFLCDWWEGDYRELSFNDLWEYFYYSRYGEQYHPDVAEWIPQTNIYRIPAEDFEELILPYFDLDVDTLRELAFYEVEGDDYPWRFIETGDYLQLEFYMCTPEVTAYENHPDGTITLTVEVLSTDLKLDCLFAHEVTVRPLENGGFQYVGNKVTYQTENGLPYCEPRLTWK